MDLEKAIKKAWDKLEAKIGADVLEGQAREQLEEWVGERPDIEVTEFVEDYLYDLERLTKAVEIINHLRRGGNGKNSTRTKTMGVKAAQIANQRFQRRVAIAGFVIFRVYHPVEIFLQLVMNDPLPKKRINWKEMVTEWNQEYPSDIMTSADVFRITFYRILRESEVLHGIIIREMAESKEFQQTLRSLTERLRRLEQSDGGQRALREAPIDEVERYRRMANGFYRLRETLNPKGQKGGTK